MESFEIWAQWSMSQNKGVKSQNCFDKFKKKMNSIGESLSEKMHSIVLLDRGGAS